VGCTLTMLKSNIPLGAELQGPRPTNAGSGNTCGRFTYRPYPLILEKMWHAIHPLLVTIRQ
jgi:hypothetical protein